MSLFNFFKKHHLKQDGLTISLEYRVFGQKVFGLELNGMDLTDILTKLGDMIANEKKKN